MFSLRNPIVTLALLTGSFFAGTAALFPHEDSSLDGPAPLPYAVQEVETGWKIRVVREMPETVSSLAMVPDTNPSGGGALYVGTDGAKGGVYRFDVSFLNGMITIGEGLGDSIEFGTCSVNSLALHDIDHDGIAELLATTCQILPIGRPRLYVWSMPGGSNPVPQSMTRPAIASSWSHGLGFARSDTSDAEEIFTTFCGHGEIVAYQPVRGRTAEGLTYETMAWKQVGQLPASGEQTVTADVDNDGREELCLAVGFSLGKAAIHTYAVDSKCPELQLKTVINEQGRFGNVRFVIGDLSGDGTRDLVAWWCTDIAGGDAEVIRYHLGPEGVRRRTVLGKGAAADLFPTDGQMALMDMNRDGRPEVWSTTGSGNLWRYDPAQAPRLTRVLHFDGGLGPILGGSTAPKVPARLFVGQGRHVLQIQAA